MSWWDIQPDSSEYGGRTVIGLAWPNVDESVLAQAARSFEEFRDQLRSSVIADLRRQMMALSDAWEGSGSEAARDEASAIIDNHEANANLADAVARKLRTIESAVANAKKSANSNAEQTQRDCEATDLRNDLSPEERAALNGLRVNAGFDENVGVVQAHADGLASDMGLPSGTSDRPNILPEGVPTGPGGRGNVSSDETHVPFQKPYFDPALHTSGETGSRGSPAGGQPASPPPSPKAPTDLPPAQAPNGAPQPVTAGSGGSPSALGSPSSGGGSGAGLGSGGAGSGSSALGSSSSSKGAGSPPGSANAGTGSGQSPSVSAAAADGNKSAANAGRPAGGLAGQPLAAQPSPPPLSAPAPAPQPTAPSASAPSAPAGSTSTAGVQGLSGATGGGFGGTAAGGAAGPPPSTSPPPVPLGPPTTPAPPAPVNPGAAPGAVPAGPAVAAASTNASSAAPAPVPVSAARAERDAIAAAATAGALRRKNQGSDPAQSARRIAAALNAGSFDFGFYWVTAVMTDGAIVVANSYGMGYIPADVRLPEGVHLATADESIPASERARWATYPILAVQGWAQHHNQKVRCVIATEDQFEGFDPGAPKIVLQPDDIPDSGSMQGRSRLEVIAPEAASRLAATSDAGLPKLLPPAQIEADMADDDLIMLWFAVSKPLMSRSTGRVKAHLEAFAAYSERAMELALQKAQTEPAVEAQRAAIADWV